jgi:hypothetical protein
LYGSVRINIIGLTGLYDLDDSTELSNLPLSGDGIFGSVFNSFKGGLGNRNFEKKGQFDNKGQNSRPNNFRIPKFNKNNSAQGTRGDTTAGIFLALTIVSFFS